MSKTAKVITIETHRRVLIRSLREAFAAWCDPCGRETMMLTPEQASVIWGATQRKIFHQIENGHLHFMETEKGALFVCSNSLELSQNNSTGESES
jgi:hypothetical protein